MFKKLTKLLIITVSLLLLFFIFPEVQAQMAWEKMMSPAPRGNLLGVSGESKTDIFAVGVGGIIRHYDGDGDNDGKLDTEWEVVPSPTGNNLNAVWGGTKSGVYAVGDNATILFAYMGIHWSIMRVPKIDPPVGHLYGIWGSSKNSVFAVGEQGVILHYDGDGDNDGNPDNIWEIMEPPDEDKQALRDVWGSSPDNIFAVGYEGTIRHYNGIGWSDQTSDTTKDLQSVWGITGSSIVAVGSEGRITYSRDRGSKWTAKRFGGNNLNGIWGISPGTVFAAGNAGTVFHYINYEVFERNIPERINLNDVWVSQNTHVFVVGDGGIIYQLNLEGYYWMEGKVCSACSGNPINLVEVCEVISQNRCDRLQNGITNSNGEYGRNRFTTRPHTFRFSATDHQSEERSVDLLLNCSITNNTFLFKDPEYKQCIAGVVSKVCDSYSWYIGGTTENVIVKLDKAIGCEFPGTYNYASTTTDSETGLYYFSDLADGVYKIKIEADGCAFTPVNTNVATIPHTEPQAYDFVGTGTGLCACPVPSEVPTQCNVQ